MARRILDGEFGTDFSGVTSRELVIGAYHVRALRQAWQRGETWSGQVSLTSARVATARANVIVAMGPPSPDEVERIMNTIRSIEKDPQSQGGPADLATNYKKYRK